MSRFNSPVHVVFILMAALAAPAVHAQQAGAQEGRKVRYISRQWSFDGVDIGKLTKRLARIGLEIPIELEGEIVGSLSVGVPWGALRDARAWRFGGQLSSEMLKVNRLALEEISVSVQYRDGDLQLNQLRVLVPPTDADAQASRGEITGKGSLQLVPRGQASAELQMRELPLSSVTSTSESLPPLVGRLSGNLKAKGEVEQLNSLQAWSASGPVAIEDLVFRDLPESDAAVQLGLQNGVFSAMQMRLNLGESTLTGDAKLNLFGQQEWRLDARVDVGEPAAVIELLGRVFDVDDVEQLVQRFTLDELEATAELAGTLTPWAAAINGRCRLTNLQLQLSPNVKRQAPLADLNLEHLEFRYAVDRKALRLSQVQGRLSGGELLGDLAVPLDEPLGDAKLRANLRWSGVRLAELLTAPLNGDASSAGEVRLAAPLGALSDLAQWQAEMNIDVGEFGYLDWNVDWLKTGQVAWNNGRLGARNVTAAIDGQPAQVAFELLLHAPWSIDATFDLPRLNLARLNALSQLDHLTQQIEGVAAVSGELSGAWKPLEIRATGQLQGKAIAVGQHAIESLRFKYDLTPKSVKLSGVQLEGYGGGANGSVKLQFGDERGGAVQLEWSQIDLGTVAHAIADSPIAVRGASDGSLTLEIPGGAVASPEQWTGRATLQLTQLDVYAWEVRELAPIELELRNGRIVTSEATGQLDGQPMQFSASVGVQSPWPIDAKTTLTRLRVEQLAVLPQLSNLQDRIGGRVNLAANVQGELEPLELTGEGNVVASDLQFDDYRIDQISFDFSLASDSLRLTDVDVAAYGGRLSGEAALPLAAASPLEGAFAWSNIDLGRIVESFQQLPVQLRGDTNGEADFAIPGGSLRAPAEWRLELRFNVPKLRADEIPIAAVEAAASLQDGRLTYQGSGELFDGPLEFQGAAPVAGFANGSRRFGDVQLTLRGASLEKAALVQQADAASSREVGGTMNLDFAASQGEQSWNWRANLRLTELAVDGVEYAPELQAQMEGNEQSAELVNLSGSFAGGQLRGGGVWAFGRPAARTFRIGLRNAELGDLARLLPNSSDLALSGDLDADLRVRPGDVWRIAGNLAVRRGEAFDLDYRNARLPITIDWAPNVGRIEIRTNSVQLSAAGGRLTGRLTARQAAGWTLDGAFRLFRVDTATLFRDLGSGAQYGKGRLSGTLSISGRQVRSIEDVQATLRADLENAQTRSLPVLGDLRAYVPGSAALGSSRFNDGRLEATLTGGVIRVERLSLASNQLQLFLSGVISLSGRLRLDAVAATGQNANPILAQSLLSRMVAAAVPPASVLLAANDYLANRVVHLQIQGTVRRPIIRVKAFETLREEVIRFFLRQATGGVVAGGAAAAAGR